MKMTSFRVCRVIFTISRAYNVNAHVQPEITRDLDCGQVSSFFSFLFYNNVSCAAVLEYWAKANQWPATPHSLHNTYRAKANQWPATPHSLHNTYRVKANQWPTTPLLCTTDIERRPNQWPATPILHKTQIERRPISGQLRPFSTQHKSSECQSLASHAHSSHKPSELEPRDYTWCTRTSDACFYYIARFSYKTYFF